jgi:hypothetical protein
VTFRVPTVAALLFVVLLAAAAGAGADHLISKDDGASAVADQATETSTTRVAETAPTPVGLVDDCRTPTERPDEVVFTCGDGGVIAQHITWATWGGKLAVGHGVVLAHDCTPDCATSNKYNSIEVVLIASDSKRCGTGDRRYTRLGYSWTAGSPYPADAPGSQRPYLDLRCPS